MDSTLLIVFLCSAFLDFCTIYRTEYLWGLATFKVTFMGKICHIKKARDLGKISSCLFPRLQIPLLLIPGLHSHYCQHPCR